MTTDGGGWTAVFSSPPARASRVLVSAAPIFSGDAMGALAGHVGPPAAGTAVEAMLSAVSHRGDVTDVVASGAGTLGLRAFAERDGPHAGVVRGEGGALTVLVGRSLPALSAPDLAARFVAFASSAEGAAAPDLADLDGAFALAHWDPCTATLTLARDPFGQRSIYFAHAGDALWFATELKELLVVPGLALELDPIAVHKYLTFSFVPGESTPLAGVR